jgi:hypothetical protein
VKSPLKPEGQYRGANIGAAAFKIIEQYDISIKADYCVRYCNSNNDAALSELQILLNDKYGEGIICIPPA